MSEDNRREATGCPVCGGIVFWRSRTGARVCARCYPAPLEALGALTRRTPGLAVQAPRPRDVTRH
jgi:hypothetical protein